MNNSQKILVIGAGVMAKEYLKALESLKFKKIFVLTRSKKSAYKIRENKNVCESFSGGLNKLKDIYNDFDYFVISCPIENLLEYIYFLQESGKTNILVEKPVSLKSKEISVFNKKFPKNRIIPALNRLYFPSIIYLRKLLKNSKPTSAFFSFTEWTDKINYKLYSKKVTERWGIANSIHVIYSIFDLIGYPKTLNAYVGGKKKIKWHSSGSIFSGSGITELNIPFTYLSDWNSSGRWGIRINTNKGSFILEPMEELLFQKKNCLDKKIILPNWSGNTKCGVAEMLKDWLSKKSKNFKPSLITMQKSIRTAEKIVYQMK